MLHVEKLYKSTIFTFTFMLLSHRRYKLRSWTQEFQNHCGQLSDVVTHTQSAADCWSCCHCACMYVSVYLWVCMHVCLSVCLPVCVLSVSVCVVWICVICVCGLYVYGNHVLQPYLPAKINLPYQLWTHSHNMTLINKTKLVNDSDFIVRMLYKYSYWFRPT